MDKGSRNRLAPLLLLLLLLLGLTPPGVLRADTLVMNSGSTASGVFLSLDMQQVHFQTNDGRTIDHDRKEVFGIFADEAPKKLLKPTSDVKGEMRVGSSIIKGQILRFDPSSAFVFYSSAGKAKIALLKPEDKLLYLKISRSESPDGIDCGAAFAKEIMKVSKAISKDNTLLAVQLGEQYLKLSPSSKGMAEVEIHLASLRKIWKDKVKDYFKLVSVEVGVRSDTHEPLLTYHIYSKQE